ncbi:MAG: M23 family metallopeptidase [Chloroflexi bacterium]|nr:M23 family metallopeptidase [Chloroflexota bacterium]
MTQPFMQEPTPDHLADTGPVRSVRLQTMSPFRRLIGLMALLFAFVLTAASAALLLLPPSAPVDTPAPNAATPAPTTETAGALPTADSAALPTAAPLASESPGEAQFVLASAQTLNEEARASLLAAPLAVYQTTFGFEIPRTDYSAFTIIPDRPRSEVIQYEVQQGDTIYRIAERFGIQPETIAWANDRSLIGGLRPGRRINIMPLDGVYHTILVEQTVQEIANQFGVDPYAIIDSEYNDLFGADPTTPIPPGTSVVVPGGVAEQIVWNPVVERVGGDESGSGGRISFSPGDPGSCGLVDNPGGGGGWVRPLNNYTWTQGFSSIHTGVDLAAAEGTPVMAANGGTVIFAGWNNWGYGYLVVLAHGPFTTIYGHLSSFYVNCGQYISAGQQIGGVGSTGQSTGTHLHFEIRYNDVPQNPTSVMPL